MFLKASTPLVRDTIILTDNQGEEITRFVAVWHRPDAQERKELMQANLDSMKTLYAAQVAIQENDPAYGMDQFNAELFAVEEDGKARIRRHLNSIEGLLDADDQPLEYSPAVIDELFRWVEYTTPLAESLVRLSQGKTVEDAQVKNSVTLVHGGPAQAALV